MSLFSNVWAAVDASVMRTTVAVQALELRTLRERIKRRGFHDEANAALVAKFAEVRKVLGAGHLGNRDESTTEAAHRVVAERDGARLSVRDLEGLRGDAQEVDMTNRTLAARVRELEENGRRQADLQRMTRAKLDPDQRFPAQGLDVLAGKRMIEREVAQRTVKEASARELDTMKRRGAYARDLVRLANSEGLDELETTEAVAVRDRIVFISPDSEHRTGELKETIATLEAKLRCVHGLSDLSAGAKADRVKIELAPGVTTAQAVEAIRDMVDELGSSELVAMAPPLNVNGRLDRDTGPDYGTGDGATQW